MLRLAAAAIVTLTASASAVPACAQDFFSGNIQSALNTSSISSLNITRSDVIDEGRSGATARQPNVDRNVDYARVPSPPIAAFRPTPEVTTQVNNRFIDMMSRGQPGKRDEMAQFIDNGALRQTFERLMAAYNLAPYNLADVIAAHYIVLWEVVHDQVPTPAEIRGTRGRIVFNLARKPQFRAMSSPQKQEAAETLKMLSALALTNYEDFKRRGDRRGLAGFQATVGNWTRRQGIDLAPLAITDHGFVRR